MNLTVSLTKELPLPLRTGGSFTIKKVYEAEKILAYTVVVPVNINNWDQPTANRIALEESTHHEIIDNKFLTLVNTDNQHYYEVDLTPLYPDFEDLTIDFFPFAYNKVGLVFRSSSIASPVRFLNNADLNPENFPECGNPEVFSSGTYQCHRPENHLGQHQAFDLNASTSWGSSGGACYPEPTFGVPDNCAECGMVVTRTTLESHPNCFSCSFWQNLVDIQGQKPTFIVEHVHYMPGRGGFGGQVFELEKHDGQRWSGELVTQGVIPSYFRDRLPDTAVFLNNKQPVSHYWVK